MELYSPLIILIIGMATAAFIDLKIGKIPNLITLPMSLAGLIWHGYLNGIAGFGFSIAGLLLGIAIFIIPYIMGGMGAGDVKLLGAAGAILGVKGVTLTAVLSILIGFIYAAVLLFCHPEYFGSMLRRFWAMIKTLILTGQLIFIPPPVDRKQPKLKYAVPIALGSLVCVYLKINESNLVQYF